MQAHRKQSVEPAGSEVVVAVFLSCRCACDAIVDLVHAGFGRHQINVAFPIEKASHHEALNADSNEGHTLNWRLRQSFEHDLHRRGAEQLAGKQENPTEREPLYSEVNLAETLRAMNVPDERIQLLNWEIGSEGALLLVYAGDRYREATLILERTSGDIRTESATERPHVVV